MRTHQQRRHRTRRSPGWRIGVPTAFVAAGLLASTSMVNAQGTDLRGGRSGDLEQLVLSQRDMVAGSRQRVRQLRREIDGLTTQVGGRRSQRLSGRISGLEPATEMTPVSGAGVSISLTDAPRDVVVPDGTDANVLVVHQQDIQAVVNAMWAGGARGVTVQGQRIVSTTGIKCVGNTVVLHGVPYSPPYVVEAVGDVDRLTTALDESPAVQSYLSYTAAPYHLGWTYERRDRLRLPGYSGEVELAYARPTA